MENACIASEAICQRALKPLFTALCPVPVTEMAGNSKECVLSGCVNDLYFFGTGRRVSKNPVGVLLTSKAQAQAIKMSYGMNTTLIQSQLLILDHFFGQECISWLGGR